MRKTFVATMGLVVLLAVLLAGCGGQNTQLRFNGIYVGELNHPVGASASEAMYCDCLRFFEDGTYAETFWARSLLEDVDVFAQLASRTRGTYEVIAGQVKCSAIKDPNVVANPDGYEGVINGDTLELGWVLRAFGDVAQGTDAYHFMD